MLFLSPIYDAYIFFIIASYMEKIKTMYKSKLLPNMILYTVLASVMDGKSYPVCLYVRADGDLYPMPYHLDGGRRLVHGFGDKKYNNTQYR